MSTNNFGISSWTAGWGGITAMARWKHSNRLYFGGLAPFNGRYETTIAMKNSILGDRMFHLISSSLGSYGSYYAPEYLEEINDHLVGVSSPYDINHNQFYSSTELRP
jgi:hypothetical protein